MIDRPILRKSPAYVQVLLAKAQAFSLDEHSVQLFEAQIEGWSPKMINRPRHWQPVRGSLQFIDGDAPGRKGHFSYPIPVCGAKNRPMWVCEINA